jgi:hypothetical protein
MGMLLWEDLRNRRVVRVGVAYVFVAAALLVGLGTIEAAVGLPDWTIRMVAGLSFFALPFLLVMIWALEDGGPESPRAQQRVGVAGMFGATSRTDRTP